MPGDDFWDPNEKTVAFPGPNKKKRGFHSVGTTTQLQNEGSVLSLPGGKGRDRGSWGGLQIEKEKAASSN